MLGSRNILGLAIEEHSILMAELHIDGEHCWLRRTAEFVFPEGVCFDEPAKLGQHLRQFLRKRGLSAKTAILGIPAKWLVARQKTIPPVNPDSLAGILHIQAEQDFSLDFRDLVFDYSGEVSSTDGRSVLLVATRRKTIDQIIATARSASLNVRSVTLSSLALAQSPNRGQNAYRYGLYIRPDCAEFLVQNDKYLRSIKHLPVRICGQADVKSGVETLAIEVQRLFSFLPEEHRKSEPYKLTCWDATDLGTQTCDTLRKCLGRQVEVLDGSAGSLLGKLEMSVGTEIERFKAPAALAMIVTRAEPLTIDFLNSRISSKKKVAHKRQIMWAVATATVLLLCLSYLLVSWQRDKEEVAALRQYLESVRPDIQAAQSVVQKVSFAGGWYSERPRFLSCLRELTLAFPEQGTIWVTSLAVRENMQAVIAGKSIDESEVLKVLDKLKQSEFFSDVQMLYMREAGRNTNELSFAISFTFIGTG